MPEDPGTLLRTPQSINILPISGGEYWHQGFANCIKKIFQIINEPLTISLNLNIDGLLLYNNSKVEFWPILINIVEVPEVPPLIWYILGKGENIRRKVVSDTIR